MSHKNNTLLASMLIVAALALSGQGIAWAYDPFSSLIPQVPVLRDTIESDFPGATIPAYPFLHTPRWGGEVRVTPIFYSLVNGTFLSPADGLFLQFKKDLGYEDQVTLIELTGRVQLNRFSVRAVYDAYLRTLRGGGAGGTFSWPDFRFGFDLDVIQRPNFKFGIDMDMNWERPRFSIASPILGDFFIEGPRPVTFGLHCRYSPEGIPVISPVFEMKYRWPIRTGSKIYEFEIAGGFKLPRTVLGESALRAGWRRTQIEFGSEGHIADVTLSGFFGEYVFYY